MTPEPVVIEVVDAPYRYLVYAPTAGSFETSPATRYERYRIATIRQCNLFVAE